MINDNLFFLVFFFIPNFDKRLWLITTFDENLQKFTTKKTDVVFHIIL